MVQHLWKWDWCLIKWKNCLDVQREDDDLYHPYQEGESADVVGELVTDGLYDYGFISNHRLNKTQHILTYK